MTDNPTPAPAPAPADPLHAELAQARAHLRTVRQELLGVSAERSKLQGCLREAEADKAHLEQALAAATAEDTIVCATGDVMVGQVALGNYARLARVQLLEGLTLERLAELVLAGKAAPKPKPQAAPAERSDVEPA